MTKWSSLAVVLHVTNSGVDASIAAFAIDNTLINVSTTTTCCDVMLEGEKSRLTFLLFFFYFFLTFFFCL